MALVVFEGSFGSNTDTDTYATSVGINVAVGNLMFVVVAATTTTAAAPVVTSSLGLTTFVLVTTQTLRSSTDTHYVFVGNRFETSSLSQVITVVLTGDAAESGTIAVFSVSGMTRVGPSAIRQIVGKSNDSNLALPTLTFTEVTRTENPVVALLANASGSGVSPPTGFTQIANPLASAVPIVNLVSHDSSGFASSTLTWNSLPIGATSSLIALELDTSPANRMLSTGVGL